MDILYYFDAYAKEFEAEVLEVNGKYIVLDKTAFYAAGGGQPYDTGKIISDNEYNVVSVGKVDGKISHEVDKEGLKTGDKVKGIIDWDRRYKLMRMHTAAHIISTLIHNKTGALITGNQLDTDKTRVDYSSEIGKDKIEEYIKEANEIINRNLEVKSYFISKEEAAEIEGLTKLAMKLPEREKIRSVEIGDFDKQADGGTHVKNTREIGKIVFLRVENKGKDRKRLYFELSWITFAIKLEGIIFMNFNVKVSGYILIWLFL